LVLADTSTWISYLHRPNERLKELLESRKVVCHPLVIGELACGRIPRRDDFLTLLQRLPESKHASHEEVLAFIEEKQLWGVGLAYVDVHLLASALLSHIPLWTEDKHLRAAAEALGVAYTAR